MATTQHTGRAKGSDLLLTGMMATMALDGPINRDAFQAYVEQVLVRELRPGGM